jgi:hypothetical protein
LYNPNVRRVEMTAVTVSNAELRTVRDAMRELNRMIDLLAVGELSKFVLTQRNQMKVVLLPLERFVEMERCATTCVQHVPSEAVPS